MIIPYTGHRKNSQKDKKLFKATFLPVGTAINELRNVLFERKSADTNTNYKDLIDDLLIFRIIEMDFHEFLILT